MAKAGRLVKELMVRELAAALADRSSFFVASIGALQATEADELRKRLRSVQARMLLVKRTLARRGVPALQRADGLETLFSGSVALIVPGEDLIPAAKLLADFAKDRKEKLLIRGGWVEGQAVDQARFQEVAGLPAKPQLIAQLIGVLESPLTSLIFTVEQVLGDVPWVLEEASHTKENS